MTSPRTRRRCSVSGRYTVEFERSAKKEFDRLDGPIRARVLRKVAALEDDPGLLARIYDLGLTCRFMGARVRSCCDLILAGEPVEDRSAANQVDW